MVARASFTPTGARAARPEQFVIGADISFAEVQEIQRGTRVKPRNRFGVPEYEGVSPQKSFGSRELGTLDTDKMLDKYADGSRINPFEVVGVPTTGAMSTWVEFIDDYDFAQHNDDPLQQRYDPKTQNIGDNSELRRGGDRSAAPQSVVPTSTTNPNRPRTLSAGYALDNIQAQTGHITVMFRDGTMYNWYQVPASVWNDFKTAPSKGWFIREKLDNAFPRGFASGGNVAGRRTLHRAARVAQRQITHRRGPATVNKATGKGKTVQVRRQTHR